MSADRLRLGILSGVRHAAQYAHILQRDERVNLVAVAEDPDSPEWMLEASEALARDLDVPFVVGLERMLDDVRPQAALVCTEPTRHAPAAIAALERSIDTLVDKPVATTLAGARAVQSAASSARCSVINRTFSPATRRLRRWIDDGAVGLPQHLNIEFLSSGARFAAAVERPELVLDPDLSGGGELLNFLGYAVDAVRYLTGLEVVEVFAETSTLFAGGHAARQLEDTAAVSLLLQNGVTATAVVGRTPAAAGPGAGSSLLRVIGSQGTASADDAQPQLTRFGADDSISAIPIGGDGGAVALESFLKHFVDALVDETPFDYSIADAVATLRVIDAAYRSAATGENVHILDVHPKGSLP